jgi:hypothetical protein
VSEWESERVRVWESVREWVRVSELVLRWGSEGVEYEWGGMLLCGCFAHW